MEIVYSDTFSSLCMNVSAACSYFYFLLSSDVGDNVESRFTCDGIHIISSSFTSKYAYVHMYKFRTIARN